MKMYTKTVNISKPPRLPIRGLIDLTYRCNNDCLHCWLRLPPDSEEREKEINLEEIRGIVDEARSMGTQRWAISGGEPMLRPDFVDIFEYLTKKAIDYSLNTNGTLITPEIARLLRKKGSKMVVLYGATSEVHDHITRNPGSFEKAMQGFAYLKEAGAGFTVQLVPMKDNYHQFQEMISLAKSLSPHWRIGAAWLHLSASGNPEKNCEIERQRLPAKTVLEIDKPDFSGKARPEEVHHQYLHTDMNDGFFASCAGDRNEFHIDPYGEMTFCPFIKDRSLRYDLRKGSFAECWDDFLPSLKSRVKGGEEYKENCGSCELRKDCRWCPAYGFLEHRRYSAKIEYLCEIARECHRFKKKWEKNNQRFYGIGGITLRIGSDIPITDETFHPKFKIFEIDEPGPDVISIDHSFFLPDIKVSALGKKIYERPPWAIFKKGTNWIYLSISPSLDYNNPSRVVLINDEHTRARIFSPDEKSYRRGSNGSLTLLPTDQIILARSLAEREGCYIHSSGVSLDNKGLLFVGHSDAGKSTMVKMLKGEAKILCDDRIIVRRHAEGFKIYGTWSHGDIPDVSPDSAPLQAILFLEKDVENRIVPLADAKDVLPRLLACLIKPIVTPDWWDKMLSLVERIVREVPCYALHFDKSGKIVNLLKHL